MLDRLGVPVSADRGRPSEFVVGRRMLPVVSADVAYDSTLALGEAK